MSKLAPGIREWIVRIEGEAIVVAEEECGECEIRARAYEHMRANSFANIKVHSATLVPRDKN